MSHSELGRDHDGKMGLFKIASSVLETNNPRHRTVILTTKKRSTLPVSVDGRTERYLGA